VTSFISHTTVDCANAYELSEWWKPVLGYADLDGDPNLPGHEECMIRDLGTGHQILFIEVPDTKAGKNRIHFDLRPARAPATRSSSGCSPSARASSTTCAASTVPGPPGSCWRTRRATSSASCGPRARSPRRVRSAERPPSRPPRRLVFAS
jgi:hypothetical protein